MIDPSRFAEDIATNCNFLFPESIFAKPVQKTNREAIENWEDEGGASIPPDEHGERRLYFNPSEESNEAAKCARDTDAKYFATLK